MVNEQTLLNGQNDYGDGFADKQPMYPGCSPLLPFLFQTFVVFPIWLALVVPATLVYQLFARCFVRRPRPRNPFEGVETTPTLEEERVPIADRKYDFVLMGATGFTGRLACQYIAAEYGTRYKWAIAGRKRSKLESVRESLVSVNSKLKDVPIEVADSKDAAQVTALARSCRVVITTVGPYALYGAQLVAACAREGTQYVDITGEIGWVRHVIANLDATARTTGARLVPCCGHDSAPWDLAVQAASDAIKAQNDTIKSISFYDDIRAAPSGGTLATLFASFATPLSRTRRILGADGKSTECKFDTMVLDAKGSKSPNRLSTRTNPSMCCSYSGSARAFVGPFVMQPVNANVVKRSNALLNYSRSISYYEVLKHSGLMSAWLAVLERFWFATAIFFPPWKALLMCVKPRAGQGPSAETIAQGYLRIKGIARGNNGSKATVRMGLTTDPAYEDTARMLVECALCALDAVASPSGDEAKTGSESQPLQASGVLTPASAFGAAAVRRFQTQGRGAFFKVSGVTGPDGDVKAE